MEVQSEQSAGWMTIRKDSLYVHPSMRVILIPGTGIALAFIRRGRLQVVIGMKVKVEKMNSVTSQESGVGSPTRSRM